MTYQIHQRQAELRGITIGEERGRAAGKQEAQSETQLLLNRK